MRPTTAKMVPHLVLRPFKSTDLDLDAAEGDTVLIADGYCRPRLQHNGANGPSILEQLGLSGHVQPVNPEDVASPVGGPAAPQPAVLPTVAGLMAAGVAEGLAEQIVGLATVNVQAAKAAKPMPGSLAAAAEKAAKR